MTCGNLDQVLQPRVMQVGLKVLTGLLGMCARMFSTLDAAAQHSHELVHRPTLPSAASGRILTKVTQLRMSSLNEIRKFQSMRISIRLFGGPEFPLGARTTGRCPGRSG